MEEILAKKDPKETLIAHTEWVLSVWSMLHKQYSSIIVDVSFWEDSYITVLFHDLGKVTLNFQDVMHDRVKSFDNYIRHELFSGSFLLLNEKEKFCKNPLPVLCIFSHHKDLLENVFDSERDFVRIRLEKDSFDYIINYYKNKIRLDGINFSFNDRIIETLSKDLENGQFISLFKSFLKNTSVAFNIAHRKQYIYSKAILTICDWLGSAQRRPSDGFTYSVLSLKEKIINKLLTDGKFVFKHSFTFRCFQLESLIPNNVIAIAPTGSGKTEAALIWASQKRAEERIIYLLPTRVTSNSIYSRLLYYFIEDSVAIVHSSALLFRKETNENYDQKEYLRDRTFFRNVNVCTVDQVLTQGFNIGYWEVKTFHMLNAWVIIDEIHLYAPYTLALIISTIIYLKEEFGTRFYIMSATMPIKLQDLLVKTLGKGCCSIVKDKELLDKSRNIFETRNSLIDDLLIEIVYAIQDGKKVLVVVNSVHEAIRVYLALKGSSPKSFCYHSRFIQRDRLAKETEILLAERTETSLLLVATQVVEVSLDIDFDILFTENAPIDSIIQRAGRVNRSRTKIGSKVVVFKETLITRDFIYDVPEILDKTFAELQRVNGGLLTEQQLLEIVDKVYESIDIENNPSFEDGMKKYSEIQKRLHFIKDNPNCDDVYTREGLDTISVIPMINDANKEGKREIYWTEEFKNKSPLEKARYELSIRKSKKYSHKVVKDYQGYNYIDAQYSYELGMVFQPQMNVIFI